MFNRSAHIELEAWLDRPNRKPLVIRGARQVGKTTLVNQFARRFDQYIYLNLELNEDQGPFKRFETMERLLQTIFFLKNLHLTKKADTLIFIDEIQEVPEALNILRYFYEQAPEIKVIAAGSMLESLFDTNIRFPVGRVEFLVLRPVAFPEFLEAIGEEAALGELQQVPCNDFAHDKLLSLYQRYALVGGMPEIVEAYAANGDLTALGRIYDSLIQSYLDDVEKYAKSEAQINHLRHAIRASFAEAGKRIQFAGFGNSAYRSREMGESLRVLEKALLLHLVYPQTSGSLPLQPDVRKSPRLQLLDTGLLAYVVGIQQTLIGSADLSKVYQGTLIEHLTGQELLATHFNALSGLNFWVREKKSSNAEVDFLVLFEGKLVPVETKSGKSGALKSLHLFMDEAPHSLAVRLYAGNLRISTVHTSSGKPYFLLDLPYYLTSQLQAYIAWFQNQVGGVSAHPAG